MHRQSVSKDVTERRQNVHESTGLLNGIAKPEDWREFAVSARRRVRAMAIVNEGGRVEVDWKLGIAFAAALCVGFFGIGVFASEHSPWPTADQVHLLIDPTQQQVGQQGLQMTAMQNRITHDEESEKQAEEQLNELRMEIRVGFAQMNQKLDDLDNKDSGALRFKGKN